MLGVMVPSIPSLARQVMGAQFQRQKLGRQFALSTKFRLIRYPVNFFVSFGSFNEVKSISDHALHHRSHVSPDEVVAASDGM
jgi:hypothetical protein